MLEHLLLAAALLQAFALLGALRRRLGWGYVALLASVLGLVSVALLQRAPGTAAAALILSIASAGLPLALERASRWAFGRGMFSWSVRLAGWRATLMPGAGLGRQQALLRGLDLLESEGPDAALRHYEALAAATDDEGELAALDEQIVSTLLYGHRWAEAIAHFERRFHRGYAALRPTLALGLLRAYGECGRLLRAAQLLRAMEEAPIGRHPQGASAMVLARLTFLAYAGAAGVIDEIVPVGAGERAGLSAAAGAYFHGVALARSGQPRRAAEALSSVESLAGRGDRRLVAASHGELERLGEVALPDLDPELRRYVQHSARRLLSGVRRVADSAGPRRRFAAGVLAGLLVVTYAARVMVPDLLALGAATSQLVAAGSWSRVLVAPWLHVQPSVLLVDAYALWFASRIVERRVGPGVALLAALTAGAGGVIVSLMQCPSGALVGGSGPAVVAMLVAATVLVLPRFEPELSPSARRGLLTTLTGLLALQALLAWPGARGLDMSPAAYAVGILVGLCLTPWPRLRSRPLERVLNGLGVLALAGIALSAGKVAREDAAEYVASHPAVRCQLGAVSVEGPATLEPVLPAGSSSAPPGQLPVYGGLIDGHARRFGARVQVLAVEPAAVGAMRAGDGLGFDSALSRRMSATGAADDGPLARALAREGVDALHFDLRANGRVTARAVLRPLEDGSGVLLLAEPAAAADRDRELHAAILASARRAARGPAAASSCRRLER